MPSCNHLHCSLVAAHPARLACAFLRPTATYQRDHYEHLYSHMKTPSAIISIHSLKIAIKIPSVASQNPTPIGGSVQSLL